MKMDNITSAEYICDLIAEGERLDFNENMVHALCKARYETMCKHSPIQEYKCQVKILFMPQSQQEPICVDTCLQNEIQGLIRKYGVWTIGSCCGHGRKQGYIQVEERNVGKMLELGYKKLPIDQYGNGENCFAPKTTLYTEPVADHPTEHCEECEYFIDGRGYEYDESDCGCDGLKPFKRPPQSWCYVESEVQGE